MVKEGQTALENSVPLLLVLVAPAQQSSCHFPAHEHYATMYTPIAHTTLRKFQMVESISINVKNVVVILRIFTVRVYNLIPIYQGYSVALKQLLVGYEISLNLKLQTFLVTHGPVACLCSSKHYSVTLLGSINKSPSDALQSPNHQLHCT